MATAVNKEEARKRLTPLQWHVTQEKGTERPFTGCYNKFYEKGTYTCIVCDQELFASDTKYDSGCGWPAFNEVLDQGRIKLTKDTSHGPCKNQTLLEIGQLPQTVLECRTVRIGSYKYIPREKVVISHAGVRFRVPLLENDGSFVTLDVNYNDIVKLLIHFGKTMPVLFFYMSTSAGVMIRELLGMEDPKGPYYDPAGKDRTHKCITLLPNKLPEDLKVILTSLFSRGDKLKELSPKEANDILVRASPRK